jgi:uncharacterized protein
VIAAPRYAPELRLRLDEAPAPASLRASISAVSLQAGLEGADRVEVTLVNEGLRWLDHPLLRVGTRLALALGYAPGPLPQMFAGEVVGQTASFPAGGAPTLTVAAQDRRHRLQQGTAARWFNLAVPSVANFPLPDPVVLGQVSLEHGLVPVVEPVAAALGALLAGAQLAAGDPSLVQRDVRAQLAASDYELVARVARENGWEILVDHDEPLGGHKLRFMSPLDHVVPDLTLGYGRSLLHFSPRLSTVGQVASVAAYVWLSALEQHVKVTVGWDWDRMALTLDVRPALAPAAPDATVHLLDEPLTPASAPRRLLAELLPRLNARCTGSGSTVGDPRIVPGAVLRLDGVGEQFGGLWRVTAATHTLDAGGYRTAFEVRKEIWFGGLP